MRVAGSMHRDIEVKEVYLFSKMRFPPRSLYKSLKSKDRRMITALAASIQRHFRFSWTYKFLKCVLFFSQNVYIYDFNMQLTSTKETSTKKISPLALSRGHSDKLCCNQIIFDSVAYM